MKHSSSSPRQRRPIARSAMGLAAGALAVAVLGACSTPGAAASRAEKHTPSANTVIEQSAGAGLSAKEKRNVITVQKFYNLTFNQKNPQQAARDYLGDPYIQHNPEVKDGARGFVEGIGGYLEDHPDLKAQTVRTFAQGDLVGLQTKITLGASRGEDSETQSTTGGEEAVMDIFRLDCGKIVEHWDAIQEVPAKSANGHTMFDGPTQNEAVSPEVLKKNTESTRRFLELAFNQANAQEAVDKYVGNEYIQHNPQIADGKEAFVQAFAGSEPLTGGKATKFPRFIAQGRYVMAQTFAPSGEGMAGNGSIDIFRFDENGKIVEHWDAVQDYPARTASGNTVWANGK